MSLEHEDTKLPMPATDAIAAEPEGLPKAEDHPRESLTESFRKILGSDSSKMDLELAAKCVTMLVQSMDPKLDLNQLLRWDVSDDLYEAAARISTELGQDITLTKTENSVSGGRTIETKEGVIVLVPASTMRNLVDGPDGVAQYALNLLHHELCHVHDYAVRKAMPGWKDQMTGLPLTNRMIGIVILLWDEYSANRRSVSSSQKLVERAQLQLVVDEYPGVNEEIVSSIESWRSHRDMRQLFTELADSFGHLFKLLGYVLGSLAGREIGLQEFDQASYDFLRQTWLSSLLEAESIEQLNTLYESFGSWSGIEVFDDFAETCRLVYWDAGIQIYASPHGLTADI